MKSKSLTRATLQGNSFFSFLVTLQGHSSMIERTKKLIKNFIEKHKNNKVQEKNCTAQAKHIQNKIYHLRHNKLSKS